ncbi:MAG: NAD(P)/FAD-dependent oxidoreductase [Deltaproteobacteria bacterium]|nr:NAD(P)/FAD-dependent oxidoreductase [Deltaproteobacteria bacterium]
MRNENEVDVVVVGGGVIGCAIAAALAPRHSVCLLEQDPKLGLRTSSRNSGVIHSGLYYRPGSLKARTCVEGNARLYEWCARHGVPFRKTQKLVLARTDEELPHLERLHDNAKANGAAGVALIDRNGIASIEPHVDGVAALLCRETGIVDAVALSRSLAAAASRAGAHVVTHARVLGVEAKGGVVVVDTTQGPISASHVVNAAGFDAPAIAALFGVHAFQHHACRGDYFRLRTRAAYRALVYPVRVPGDPGLGIHLTLDLDGRARLGPDARYVDDAADVAPADHLRERFAAAASRLLGPVVADDLVHDGCGIRPKLAGPGEVDRDFVLHEEPAGVLHLMGIESPGLTSALALADEVARRLGQAR